MPISRSSTMMSTFYITMTSFIRHDVSTKEFNLRPTRCRMFTPPIPTQPRQMSSVCVCVCGKRSDRMVNERKLGFLYKMHRHTHMFFYMQIRLLTVCSRASLSETMCMEI